jgi:hypothetical protein
LSEGIPLDATEFAGGGSLLMLLDGRQGAGLLRSQHLQPQSIVLLLRRVGLWSFLEEEGRLPNGRYLVCDSHFSFVF